MTGSSAVRDADRRTLIACSGGADSAALVLALADRGVEIAHILHDLRPAPEAEADRDAVQALAQSLGIPFAQASVEVRDRPGNAEANASRARYDALRRLAEKRGIAFVATAHHADDQLETLLLRLARGSGAHGLRGIAPSRRLGQVRVIRPMLEATRAESRALCAECGFDWREDRTNTDLSRARAAIRHTVVPALLAVEPRALGGASRTARQMRLASVLIDAEAQRLLAAADSAPDHFQWPRDLLAKEPATTIGAALRQAATRLLGNRFADARHSDAVLEVVRAIRDASPHARRFAWRGLTITLDRRTVRIERNES